MRKTTRTNTPDTTKAAGSVGGPSNNDNPADAKTTSTGNSNSADRVVEKFHKADGKIAQARAKLLNDPDTLGDKAMKSFIPSIIGIVGGKVFQSIWDSTVTKNHKNNGVGGDAETTHQQGLMMSLLFAVLSAAFGAVIGELSTRGTQAFVTRRQGKRR